CSGCPCSTGSTGSTGSLGGSALIGGAVSASGAGLVVGSTGVAPSPSGASGACASTVVSVASLTGLLGRWTGGRSSAGAAQARLGASRSEHNGTTRQR